MAYLAVISFPSAFCFVLLCILFFFLLFAFCNVWKYKTHI